VPEVVEDDQGVRNGEAGLGDGEIVCWGVGKVFEITHGVVGEVPHGAAHERR
jgi:hypothetical protein